VSTQGAFLHWELRYSVPYSRAYDKHLVNIVFNPDLRSTFYWHPQHTTVLNIGMLNSEGACEMFGAFEPDPVRPVGDEDKEIIGTSKTMFGFRTAAAAVQPKTRATIF